jgi:tetratricopeptide (TPR) repeat protein
MRYVCLNCGNRFELDEGKGENKKIRCPSCMRQTGIERLGEPKVGAGQRPWLVPGIAIAVIAAAAGGYGIWRASAPREVGEDVRMAPLDADELEGHIRRLRVDVGDLAQLLAADEGIEELAEEATEGRRDAVDQATGVQEWMRERAAQHAFTRWSLGVPRETPIGTAAEVRTWLREDGARRQLYPLEAAALMTAALRSRGLAAMIAEAWEFPGDRAPPDPSGHFGYYVVAIYEGEAGEGDPHLFDPWGGHEVAPEEGSFRVLDDTEALGAAMNLRALHLLVRENDASRALDASTDALRLDDRSPVGRSVRGAILLASGGATEGLAEFESAKQIRADAPRHQLLAGVYLAQGEMESARREIDAALEESPDYANAHAALAAIHLSEGESDLAHEQLETAQRLDPDLHTLPGLWAGYYAATGELDRAVESARQAVERNPWDIQQRLMAARVYRQAARYDDMRREARAVIERTPAGQRAEMEELIRRLLGSTALEDPLAEDDEELLDLEDEEGEEGSEGGSGQFQLGSRLLGEGGGGGGSPGLLEGGGEGGGGEEGEGPLLMLGDPSRLRLGGGGGGEGDQLHLDLEE